MERKRVVVTGMGTVTPTGIGLNDFWNSITAGVNGIHRVRLFDPTEYRSQMAAEIHGFDPLPWMDKKIVQRFDRFSTFAVSSAVMAFKDAGLDQVKFDAHKAGVIIGSAIGGADTIQEGAKKLAEKGPSGVSPFFVPSALINMAASLVSIQLGLKGPLAAPSVACSTGGNAIGEAFRMIQQGDDNIMLAGSGEAAISPLPYAGFCALRAMSQRNSDPEHSSRPFDKHRDGFVMGEGAGMVVLEELEHAKARGARIYAELIGYGNTADAFHYTAPHPEADGMIRVMREAMKDADISPADIQHINAHGTSTVLNDERECLAIKEVYAGHLKQVLITSIKSMIGHLLGGAGAVEFIATVKSVQEGIIPPTTNTTEPDDACDVNLVLGKSVQADVHIAATNNFGFGGGNASLIVKRFED